MEMLTQLQGVFTWFIDCFSRTATYELFMITVCGFLLCGRDHMGVSAFVRALMLPDCFYERLIRFFRSTAYSLTEVKNRWIKYVTKEAHLVRLNGRIVLVGDGVKRSAEGRFSSSNRIKQIACNLRIRESTGTVDTEEV